MPVPACGWGMRCWLSTCASGSNAHASRGVVGILCRMVRALQERWPGLPMELHAGRGVAGLALFTPCKRVRAGNTAGLAPNEMKPA